LRLAARRDDSKKKLKNFATACRIFSPSIHRPAIRALKRSVRIGLSVRLVDPPVRKRFNAASGYTFQALWAYADSRRQIKKEQ
jgi:hypothetical protein